MAQQKLHSVITIGATVDNSLTTLGDTLYNLGSEIDKLSQEIIGFGKDAINEFVEYDDLMREVQAVGEFTNAEIKALDELNREIAKTSTYSNKQAAEAEVLMGQLGLSTEEIATLLPDVLGLAMAGNLNLADSVNYLFSTLKSLDMGLGEAGTLTDQMAKTAAIGATDIDTLGDSMTRLGSGLKLFKGGAPEVLTILSAISDFGEDMQGAEAGTALRNFALSLAAPAGAGRELLATLDNLGMSQDELNAYLDEEDIELRSAAAAIESLGLKVFDADGNMRGMLDIISDLREATKGLDEDVRTAALREIFGKRGYIMAENLLRVTDVEYQLEYGQIIDSEGFAESMADTMQGGLGGALRSLDASLDELKTTFGDILAPDVQAVAEWLEEIVENISELDDDQMTALVSALGGVAAAGPGMLLAAGAAKFLGYLLTPAGLISAGVVTLAALAMAMDDVRESKMSDNFGDMQLDMETLSGYVASLGEDFEAAYGEINEYSAAVDGAVESYKAASSEFSGKLLTAMLTSSTLTDADEKILRGLGDEMHTQVLAGITNSAAASTSYWEMLLGGTDEEGERDPRYADIIDLADQSYEDAREKLEGIGQGFRDALNSAFEDGTISQDEYADILSYMQSYNRAMTQAAADAQSEEDYVEMQMILHKAQTASLDEIKELAKETEEARERVLADAEDRYREERYRTEYQWDAAIAEGRDINGEKATEARKRDALNFIDEEYEKHSQRQGAKYDDMLTSLWESQVEQSGLSEAWDALGGYADDYFAGLIGARSASGLMGVYGRNALTGERGIGSGTSKHYQVGEYAARIIASLGGHEAVLERIDYYNSSGGEEDLEAAQKLTKLYAMEQIANDYAQTKVVSDTPLGLWDGEVHSLRDKDEDGFDEATASILPEYTTELARATADAFNDNGQMGAMWESIGDAMDKDSAKETPIAFREMDPMAQNEFNRIVDELSQVYDYEKVLAEEKTILAGRDSGIRDEVAAYSLMYGNASQNPDAYRLPPQDGYEATLDITPDTSEVDAAIAALDGTDIGIDAQADPDDVQRQLNSRLYQISILGRVGMSAGSKAGMAGYADGGRADEASIFGEAGAEWAIPEAHTDRTAELLNAARAASGFTWPDLIGRFGGLNADAGHAPATLVYAPVIHAANAEGVEQKLIEDKKRLDAWWENKQLKEERVTYD